MRTIPQFFRVALDECAWVTRQVIKRGSPELGSCSSCYPGCCSGDHLVEARSRGNKCKLVATLSTQVRGDSMRVAPGVSANASRKRRRERGDDLDRRARRALQLVQMRECSAGRQALEGAQVAQGNDATLRSLRDATWRPPRRRSPLPTWIEGRPSSDTLRFGFGNVPQNLRSSRRGAAAGPWGMTTELFETPPACHHNRSGGRPSRNCGFDQDGEDHCIAEERRWRERNHRWRCFEAPHCTCNRQTGVFCCGVSNLSISILVVHESGL